MIKILPSASRYSPACEAKKERRGKVDDLEKLLELVGEEDFLPDGYVGYVCPGVKGFVSWPSGLWKSSDPIEAHPALWNCSMESGFTLFLFYEGDWVQVKEIEGELIRVVKGQFSCKGPERFSVKFDGESWKKGVE